MYTRERVDQRPVWILGRGAVELLDFMGSFPLQVREDTTKTGLKWKAQAHAAQKTFRLLVWFDKEGSSLFVYNTLCSSHPAASALS